MARAYVGPSGTGSTIAKVGETVSPYPGQTISVWVGTQAEFDALSSGDKNTAGRIFVIRA